MKDKLWVVMIGGLIGLLIALTLGVWWLYQVTQPAAKWEEGGGAEVTQGELKVRASVPYWDQDRALAIAQANGDVIDQVVFFWYYLGEDGSIKRYEYAQVGLDAVKLARANGAMVSVLISNLPDEDGADWDSKRVERMLESEGSRAEHIQEVVDLAKELGVDGITIDYESVDVNQREQFSLFIKELAEALERDGKFVGVALHPKTSRLNPKGLGGFQDWSALGEAADELYLMAFNEHWDGSEPGPIASVSWIKKILAFAESRKVPREKLYLGLGLFGYDWHDGEEAEGLTYEEVEKLVSEEGAEPEWNESSGEHYFNYKQDGHEHEVWYADAGSVQVRAELAKSLGLAGLSLWRLGGEDPGIWSALESVR